jgi:hypothetical protein
MVTLKPAQVTGCTLLTSYLPSVSTICNLKFVEAPSNTLPTAKNAARIFHSGAINNDTPLSFGEIPLSPQNQTFPETRYWRLPVSAAAIFAALIERLQYDSSKCENNRLARNIRNTIDSQSIELYPLDDAGSSSGGSGRGGHGSKRERKDTGSSSSSAEGKKKARKASGGGSGTGDCGEPRKASGELITTFQLPLRPSRNIDFSSNARSQNGQSRHREITASSCSMEAPVELMDAGWNDTDPESGRSECILEHSSHLDNRLQRCIRRKPSR